MLNIWTGIVVGGAGGAVAVLVASAILGVRLWSLELLDKSKIHEWMKSNTKEDIGERFRSTRAIASWNTLTEDRVRYVCSIHRKIYLSTGENEDLWSIYDRDNNRSVYEERGVMVL